MADDSERPLGEPLAEPSLPTNDPEKEITKKMEDVTLSEEKDESSNECPICQDTFSYPITLPCGHRFCFLCIKGVHARRGTCCLCRSTIPSECIARPAIEDISGALIPHNRWYYEARSGGWWQYEHRVLTEIEKGYLDRVPTIRFQISGFTYEVDYDRLIQYRIDRPNRYRRIRREGLDGVIVKGVAGIVFIGDDPQLIPRSKQKLKEEQEKAEREKAEKEKAEKESKPADEDKLDSDKQS